jgi:hypothetical protein
MRRLILVVGLFVIALYSNETCRAEIEFSERPDGMCLEMTIGAPILFHNLAQFKCMFKVRFPDSTEDSKIEAEAGKAIASRLSGFEEVDKWWIWAAYSMKEYRNIIFLMVPHPRILDHRYTVAWNRSLNKYYLLGTNDIETYNSLLSSENFNLYSDFQFLKFCWLITSLRNPSSNIRFISSIKEVLVEAIFTYPIFNDLSQISHVKEDIVKLPSVDRTWQEGPFDPRKLRAMVPDVDTVKVKFFMAKDSDIVNVIMTMSGQKVIKYEEDKVGETIDWYSNRLR